MDKMYKFMMRTQNLLKIKLDNVPVWVMLILWSLYALMMNFLKLLFIERFLRWSSYYKEQNILLAVFTSVFFCGFLASIAIILFRANEGYKLGQRAKLHTRFKKYPLVMMAFKIVFWVIPSRLLDI
jgi:hypothetical protein